MKTSLKTLLPLTLSLVACSQRPAVNGPDKPKAPNITEFFNNLGTLHHLESDYQIYDIKHNIDIDWPIFGTRTNTLEYSVIIGESCDYTLSAAKSTFSCKNQNCKTKKDFTNIFIVLDQPTIDCSINIAKTELGDSFKDFIKHLGAAVFNSKNYQNISKQVAKEAQNKYLENQVFSNCEKAQKWATKEILGQLKSYLSEYNLEILEENVKFNFNGENCQIITKDEAAIEQEVEEALIDSASDDQQETEDSKTENITDINDHSQLYKDVYLLLNKQGRFAQDIIKDNLNQFIANDEIKDNSCFISIFNTITNLKVDKITQTAAPDCSQENLEKETSLLLKKICSIGIAKSYFGNLLKKAIKNGDLSEDSFIVTEFAKQSSTN